MVKVLLRYGLDTALIHKNIVIKMDVLNSTNKRNIIDSVD